MALKMITYQRWKKQGHTPEGETQPRPGAVVLEKAADLSCYPNYKGSTMLHFFKKQTDNEIIRKLAELARKEPIFRKEKVARLKQMIKNNQYHIPGKAVADKWFPDSPEKKY